MVRENNSELPDVEYPDETVAAHHLGPDRYVEPVLALAGEEPAGYATLLPYYNSDNAQPAYWLDELYVAPAMRSKGVGAILMRGLQRIAREDNRPSLWWGVERDNHRAIAFYDRLSATDYKATIYRLDA